MAWRPTGHLLEGELDSTTPRQVTEWMLLSMARCLPLSIMIAMLIVVASSLVGCGEGDSSGQDSRLAEDLARQLNDERLRHRRDDTRHDAELAGAESDYHGAVLGWVSTAAAAVILILLLARERRARRILERLLRLVLDRLRESRGPPSS